MLMFSPLDQCFSVSNFNAGEKSVFIGVVLKSDITGENNVIYKF